MPLQKFQDIIPQKNNHEKKSPPHFSEKKEGGRKSGFSFSSPRKSFRRTEQTERGMRRKPSRILWVVSGALVIILLISSSVFFEKTTLKLAPKQASANLDSVFGASRNEEGTPGSALPFEVLTFTQTQTKIIPATEIKQVDRRASGLVVIYNDFNSQSQRLIKNTRFETPDGLVYRVQESITVPGQKTIGGEKIPGSIEAMIYADEPGEKYNIGLRDFTIPGFRGTPRYDSFYARSKTEMTGGFSGVVKVVSEEELKKTQAGLEEAVRGKLLTEAGTRVPDGYILYPDALFISFPEAHKPPEQTDIDKNSVDVSVDGVLEGIMFREDALSQEIAKKLLSDSTTEEVISVSNLDTLTFLLQGKETISPQETKTVQFSLKGTPAFEWVYDEESLQRALAGKAKEELKVILAGYPSIERAEVTIRPFWKQTFPVDPEEIIIEKVLN